MKIDSKMRKIQQKYRKEIEQKNEKKKHTLEAVFVIFFIILLVQLSVFLGGKFPFNDAKNIQSGPQQSGPLMEHDWRF